MLLSTGAFVGSGDGDGDGEGDGEGEGDGDGEGEVVGDGDREGKGEGDGDDPDDDCDDNVTASCISPEISGRTKDADISMTNMKASTESVRKKPLFICR